MSLTGKQIANSYLDLLQMNNNNAGVPAGTPITVRDGDGNATPLQLSQGTVNINGTFQYQGVALTTNVSGLNAAATGNSLVTGIVAEDGNSKFGRTLTASTGITITNETGESGNPTFALTDTSVSASDYGPMNTFSVNAQGQITSVTPATSISATAFLGGTFSGSSLYVENNVSVSGTMAVAGNTNMSGTVSIAGNTSIGGNLQVAGSFGVSGSTSISGKLTVDNIVTSVVSATFLYGDGSNITGLAGAGTMTALNTGTGIHLTENGVTTTGITGSGTVALNTNQTFGIVSVTTLDVNNKLIVDGSATFADDAVLNFGDSNDLTIQHNGTHSVIKEAGTGDLFIQSNAIKLTNTGAASMLTLTDGQDADFPNGVQVSGTVSATSFVGPTITSINNSIATVSSTMATSIDNSNTLIATVSALTSVNAAAITSINSVIGSGGIASSATVAALSATMATSINNSNTNITTNANAITSINTVVGNNTSNIAAVSVLASVNSAAITSVNSVVGTNTTNITTNTNAITSINTVVENLSATFATSINNQATAITNLSATMATSINNTNTNLTAVSAYATSITEALSATMATSIGNHLPLAGGTLTGNVIGSLHTNTSVDATTTPDFGTYNSFVWTLKGNLTLGNPTTEVGGMGGTFVFIQDGTGSRTLSVGSEYKTVGGSITLSTAASAVDVVPYFVQVTGTVLLGAPSLALA